MSSEIIPHDPIANALEQLKKLPDEVAFEIAESYTCGLQSISMLKQRLAELRRLDAACEAAGYTVSITHAPGSYAHRYELKRKKPAAPAKALDDTIDI
jgi:hypothetical protein